MAEIRITRPLSIGRGVHYDHVFPRDATKAVRGKKELWNVVQANARYTRDIAAAVQDRNLKEVKRVVDRAKLTRRDFNSVCDRLGFPSDEGENPAREDVKGVASSPPPVPPTPPTPGETAGLDGVGAPIFFLDAEGRGGTTALALATLENDAEMVRRLIKEV